MVSELLSRLLRAPERLRRLSGPATAAIDAIPANSCLAAWPR